MIEITEWSSFKMVCITTKNLKLQYSEDAVNYDVYGYDSLIWHVVIPKNTADALDFEQYYKVTANNILDIKSPDGTPKVIANIINEITNPISIVLVPAVTPSGGTKVSTVVYNAISSDSDSIYTIPNGETLIIQSLTGGCEFKSQGSSIELWYDPNGNGSGMTIIDVLHVNGTSDQHSIYASYVGNGTRKIRLRRRAYGGGSREVFSRWEGYY
jgi:hypothetical protein